jgi:hypothetical protein
MHPGDAAFGSKLATVSCMCLDRLVLISVTTISANAHANMRHPSPAWRLALLLALAVSVWGLHYKLSLYYPPSKGVRGPAARLLSQKERPVACAQLEQALAFGKPPASAHHPLATYPAAVSAIIAPGKNFSARWVLASREDGTLHSPFTRFRPSSSRPPPVAD